jgi:N-acetylmuramic acid 6-phosphate etherase
MATTTPVQSGSIHSVPSAFQCTMPQGNYLSYEKFRASFELGSSSTEQLHPATMNLSQTMCENTVEGLKQLIQCDESVTEGYRSFISGMSPLIPVFKQSLQSNGRIIILGSGASGRIAKYLAKKCIEAFPKQKAQIIGKIAGGDSAIVRSKEGFEDSDKDGEKAVQSLKLTENDIVILLSASGSASFNVGAGHAAANCGSKVFYFYNETIPSRTEGLFKRQNNPVHSLLVDIGPQAIGGSTRLQAADLSLVCLGALLGTALFSFIGEDEKAKNYPQQVLDGMQKGNSAIAASLESFKSVIEEQYRIHVDPASNTHRVCDVTNKGYVTLLSSAESFPEICFDTTELPPTFKQPYYRREGDLEQKRPGFQAYMLGKKTNLEAWTSTTGREIEEEDLSDVNAFLLSLYADGQNSYKNRPIGMGNMVIGVIKLNGPEPIDPELEHQLYLAELYEASVAMIVICSNELTSDQRAQLDNISSRFLVLDKVPQDPLGLIQSLELKRALNLISNATMILAGNVYGNRMINMRASNGKLIDRAMGMVKSIWAETHQGQQLDDRILYHYIIQIDAKMKEYNDKGIEPPPVIAITLAMLHLNKTPDNFDTVVEFLKAQKGLSFLPMK